MTRSLLILCLLVLLPFSANARLTQEKTWQTTSDLAQIRATGTLRVLVNQSRNSFGEIKGQPIGTEYRRLQAFEQYLNSGKNRGLNIRFIPKAKDQLLAALQRGEGDLIAPGEVLPEAENQLTASTWQTAVPLVLVTKQGNRRFQRLEQLAGRTITLPAGSAAGDAVQRLNKRLSQAGMKTLKVEWTDSSLAVEDVLEMVQAGIFDYTVVEQPIAERWAKIFRKLRVDRHLAFDRTGNMAWYVRRDAPMLHASINRFIGSYQPPADQDSAFQRLYRRGYQVRNPLQSSDLKRLEAVRPLLQEHAQQNRLDWLALAAVAFKESNLNTAARGAGGATGLMQITPAAAQAVGIKGVQQKDNNIRAASRYMAMLRKRFFSSPGINERERMAFMLAAYNAGPQRIQNLREEAKRRGLNPNQWFFHVERIAAERMGGGVVNYVSSVNKYYLAYQRERDDLSRSRLSVHK